MKSAVIIKNTPKFVVGNPAADVFCNKIKAFFESLAFGIEGGINP